LTSCPPKTPRAPHPCAFCAQGWDKRTPAALALDVVLDVARVERTLLSVAFDVGFDFDVDLDLGAPFLAHSARSGDFRVVTDAGTTVEERRLSAA